MAIENGNGNPIKLGFWFVVALAGFLVMGWATRAVYLEKRPRSLAEARAAERQQTLLDSVVASFVSARDANDWEGLPEKARMSFLNDFLSEEAREEVDLQALGAAEDGQDLYARLRDRISAAQINALLLAQRREDAEQTLNHYGWIDQGKGVVRIPIERAMALVVEEWQDPAQARAKMIKRVEQLTAKPEPTQEQESEIDPSRFQ